MPVRKTDPFRQCEWCATTLVRKRFSTGRLEDRGRFLARKFCDRACKDAAQINSESVNRQTMYSRSRKYAKPICERCGTTERLHVHHRDEDITNNDPANLETLCVLCHNRHHFAGVSRTATTDLEASGTR
jgi:5-methylcytosine-specific restriction endonuclease McrA